MYQQGTPYEYKYVYTICTALADLFIEVATYNR